MRPRWRCGWASGLAAETFQLDFARTGSGGLLAGYRLHRSAHDMHVLLPDPYTFPSNLLVEHLNTDLPGTTVMGGVVSGGLGPGDTRLFRDRDVLTSGVVGVRLPGMPGVPIVSQGCRPIGYPYIVTGADGALITELGGRPPLQRLREPVEVLPPDEQELVSHGLQIGIVVDEHVAVPGQGDFMIRGLLGADPSTGAIEIGQVVEVGTTVQFQVRDAVGADKDRAWPLNGRERNCPGARLARCCLPAPGVAGGCSGSPIMTRPRSRNCLAAFPSPVSSPPGRSARSRAATRCTGSPRRWRCSSTTRNKRPPARRRELNDLITRRAGQVAAPPFRPHQMESPTVVPHVIATVMPMSAAILRSAVVRLAGSVIAGAVDRCGRRCADRRRAGRSCRNHRNGSDLRPLPAGSCCGPWMPTKPTTMRTERRSDRLWRNSRSSRPRSARW